MFPALRVLALTALLAAMPACGQEQEGPAGRTDKRVDETVQETRERVQEGVEATRERVREGADAAGERVRESRERLQQERQSRD